MPYNILLVDDDPEFREEFREAFDDYHVIEAADGPQALAIVRAPHALDLVVVDAVLPGMPGTRLLREIKKIDPALPAVMLTGYSSKEVAVEALKARADDFIEKTADVAKMREIFDPWLGAMERRGDIAASSTREKIGLLRQYLERNVHKPVSLEDAAAYVGLSPKYLSRVFRQEAGMNFNDYKTKVKIDRARELLERTHDTVAQIADALGYQNSETFIRSFKRCTGRTPTHYREDKQPAGRVRT